MANTFLILLRFFLRVDHVLVRIIDTRIYHEFGQHVIVREFKVKEIPMEKLNYLIRFRFGDDQSKLTDMNFLSQIIGEEYVVCVENESVVI
jgi:type 2A phosphatase activator TIP41